MLVAIEDVNTSAVLRLLVGLSKHLLSKLS